MGIKNEGAITTKIQVVALFDKKTGLYEKPGFARHLGDALRDWDHLRKDENTKMGKNPEDFDLWKLGVYDDETGEFTNERQQIASGVQ